MLPSRLPQASHAPPYLGYRRLGTDSWAGSKSAAKAPAVFFSRATALDGRTELREEELPHLSGYRDSRPVWVGNEIYDQLQFDLYGAVLDAAYLYNKYGAPLDYEVWQNLRSLLGWLSENWQQPDAGIWGARLS